MKKKAQTGLPMWLVELILVLAILVIIFIVVLPKIEEGGVSLGRKLSDFVSGLKDFRFDLKIGRDVVKREEVCERLEEGEVEVLNLLEEINYSEWKKDNDDVELFSFLYKPRSYVKVVMYFYLDGKLIEWSELSGEGEYVINDVERIDCKYSKIVKKSDFVRNFLPLRSQVTKAPDKLELKIFDDGLGKKIGEIKIIE